MRYIVFIIALSISLLASDFQIEYSYNTALQKAQKEDKDVMMMYSAVWCPECNYMKEVVFKEKELSSYIQKKYIVLFLDIQKDKLPEGFNYIGIPTFFFIDKNGQEKNKFIGGEKANKFLTKLKAL